MDDISESLDQQISNDLSKMAEHEPESEERKKIQNQVVELYKLRIEERKNEAEVESQNWALRIEERKNEAEVESQNWALRIEERKNEAEVESQNWARGIKLALEAAGLIIPNGVLAWSVVKCLRFEADGIVKANVTRRVLNMIKPGKLLRMIRL